jgi:hypothetical protein
VSLLYLVSLTHKKQVDFFGNVLWILYAKSALYECSLTVIGVLVARGKLYTTICWCSLMTIKLYLKFDVLEYISKQILEVDN